MLHNMFLYATAGGSSAATNHGNDMSFFCVRVCLSQMTLRTLLNHLKRVASHQDVNKMTCQNLAVCFGPVLLSQRQEASCHTNRVFIDSEELASALHFKKHIEVLHYLLQLWPGKSFFFLCHCSRVMGRFFKWVCGPAPQRTAKGCFDP